MADPGRDADRREKTGRRRWTVIKEDLAAEDRRFGHGWRAPVLGPTNVYFLLLHSTLVNF